MELFSPSSPRLFPNSPAAPSTIAAEDPNCPAEPPSARKPIAHTTRPTFARRKQPAAAYPPGPTRTHAPFDRSLADTPVPGPRLRAPQTYNGQAAAMTF